MTQPADWTRAVDAFKAPAGFDEIERRSYDDTEFAFLKHHN